MPRKSSGQVAEKLITAEELARMKIDGPCELVEGRIVRLSPAGFRRHGLIASRIHTMLTLHAAKRKLGLVVSAETGYRTLRNPDSVRAPDLAFVTNATIAKIEASGETYAPCSPDLAIEILSPRDPWEYVEKKVHEYLATGSVCVWIVNPKTETVHVYEAKRVRVLGAGETIDGGAALPGFRAKVSAFFADPRPRK